MDPAHFGSSAAPSPEAEVDGSLAAPASVSPAEPGSVSAGITRRDFVVGAAMSAPVLAAGPVLGASPASGPPPGRDRPRHPPESEVRLVVNGKEHTLRLDHRVTLLDALRERLGLPGAKKGCDHGQCGACTVLVDERRVNSCLTLAVSVPGQPITTIEGLAHGAELHPVQAAFIQHDAFQCGFCTPGQICSAVALLQEGHARSDDEIREQMSGNLCRCGAYPNIVAAIRESRDAKP